MFLFSLFLKSGCGVRLGVLINSKRLPRLSIFATTLSPKHPNLKTLSELSVNGRIMILTFLNTNKIWKRKNKYLKKKKIKTILFRFPILLFDILIEERFNSISRGKKKLESKYFFYILAVYWKNLFYFFPIQRNFGLIYSFLKNS